MGSVSQIQTTDLANMTEEKILRAAFAGLDDPMAFILFCGMLAILLIILSLPGNLLNPAGTNSTFTGYFAQGANVLVFNPQTSTVGLLAIVVPLALFWAMRALAGERE